MKFSELSKLFYEHNVKLVNEKKNVEDDVIKGVVIYSADNWPGCNYSEKERSYMVYSDSKAFVPGMLGNSIIGNCLDGKDNGVRLDHYNWKVDYCYVKGE